ncbi:hypothetical protein AVEN_18723-1, partial [Araneus ventricosus]
MWFYCKRVELTEVPIHSYKLSIVSLVISAFRFEATQELFWDGPCYFELQSDLEDNTRAGTPSPNFHTT